MAHSRRTFLKAAGAEASLVALSRPAVSRAQAGGSPDVVVVGAGAFGGWTALSLREKDASVTLLEAYGAGNPRASSGDESRQLRAGYGDRELYTRWAIEAERRWLQREREFGRPLLLRTGRLELAPDWTDSLRATKALLEKHAVPVEVVAHDELRRRYPQMSPEGIAFALFEPTAAVLRARQACLAVAEAFEKKGGRLRHARAELGRRAGRRLESVALQGGDALAGGAFVFACGPWLRKLFPELLKRKLYTPRRDVFYFGTPPGDERFSHPRLPNYSEDAYYGFPSIDSRGFKVCPTGEPREMDPDSDERIVSAFEVKRAREYLALRFPALKDQPVVESRVCQLEMSPDEHFLIDRHPDFDNVWLAGCGSGHGFKHGPVVGEYVADRVLGRNPSPELEPFFKLKAATF